MTSPYTYMWQRPTLPRNGIAWKTSSQMLKSAVPTWSRPFENGETNMSQSAFGSARPLKQWRKQLNPRTGSGQGRSGVGMYMDKPGGKVSLADTDTYTHSDSLSVSGGSNSEFPLHVTGVYCKVPNSQLPARIVDTIRPLLAGVGAKIFENTYVNDKGVYLVHFYFGDTSHLEADYNGPYWISFLSSDGTIAIKSIQDENNFHNIFEIDNWGHNDGYYIGKLVSKTDKSCISINANCLCENAKRVNDYIMPDNRYKNETKNSEELAKFKFLNPETNFKSVSCVACSPQANVIKPATTLLSKKYYTDSRAYLRARNKRYRQNLSGTEVSNIKYSENSGKTLLWPSNEQDGVRWRGPQIRSGSNCLSSCCINTSTDAVRCPAKLIYKPSNREFSVQGAVDSSSRIERLKLKTITKSASSMGGRNGKGPFGMEGANASRYTGRAEAPYFLKSKNQVCRPYHVHQDHTLCFFTPTGSIGNRFPIIPKEAGTPLYIENLSK